MQKNLLAVAFVLVVLSWWYWLSDPLETSVPRVEPVASSTIEALMTTMLPPDELARIVEYGTDSDGPDGTVAYVEPVAPDGSTWLLAYDPVDSYTGRIIRTPCQTANPVRQQ